LEYINVINSKYKEIAMRQEIFPVFKYELLDVYDNGIMDLTEYVSKENQGSISVNYNMGVQRSCTFTVLNKDNIFSTTDRNAIIKPDSKFKIYIGLKDIYTSDIYWFSQGVFYISSFTSNRSDKTIEFSCVDKFGYFGSELGYNKLVDTYTIKSGSKAYDVIKTILMTDMGNGRMCDYAEPLLSSTFIGYQFPFDITKSPDTFMSDMLIDIASVLGADIYYNTDGHLSLIDGTTDITYSTQAPIWDFSDVLPEYLESSFSINSTDLINSVRLTKLDSDDEYLYTLVENTNPLSPISVQRIGRKSYYEECDTVSTQKELDDYAKYLLNLYSIAQQTIDFSSVLLPHLDVNKVVSISDTYYNYDKERFIIQGLNIPLYESGVIGISACRVASLPYYDLRSSDDI